MLLDEIRYFMQWRVIESRGVISGRGEEERRCPQASGGGARPRIGGFGACGNRKRMKQALGQAFRGTISPRSDFPVNEPTLERRWVRWVSGHECNCEP